MLKLFQSAVWLFVVWQLLVIQHDAGRGTDFFATFILGGMCAYWATGFLFLFHIAASRGVAAFARTFRRLFLLKHPHQPARRLVAQNGRRRLQKLVP